MFSKFKEVLSVFRSQNEISSKENDIKDFIVNLSCDNCNIQFEKIVPIGYLCNSFPASGAWIEKEYNKHDSNEKGSHEVICCPRCKTKSKVRRS